MSQSQATASHSTAHHLPPHSYHHNHNSHHHHHHHPHHPSNAQPPARRLSLLDASHDDLIHDLQFDFYGSRLVTASSDQRLKVWDWCATSHAWTLNDAWKAHEASIVRVAFGHPDYGHVLASCSYDRTVRIWEEMDSEPLGSGKRWVERARLVDSRASVTDIAFSPTHLGLKLATASVDGMVRVYEAMDVVNLAHWTLMDEFEVYPDARESDGTLCLSWCKSKHLFPLPVPMATNPALLSATSSSAGNPPHHQQHPHNPQGFITPSAMLAVGCGRDHSARLFFHDAQRNRWFAGDLLPGHTDLVHDISWAPGMGRSYQLVATACRDGHVRIFRIASATSPLLTRPGPPGSPGIESPVMLTTPHVRGIGGQSGQAAAQRFPPGSLPAHALNAFAAAAASAATPAGGGSSADEHAAGATVAANGTSVSSQLANTPAHIALVASLPDHDNQVWRVQWNITGTVLSSAGDDGAVRLWRAMGPAATRWTCVSMVNTEKGEAK
ncbi:WD40-repeat-containing domain protein [Catenaria anguillulae PL171]|uniref:WD40-repeat-containing domain protein n=1 Tax=Catenaria anguillulae PL171 TaxID=765915 RepID=A0A1Y2HYF8_9FUNG|nr:WD40-repeat-containing domain protein [Catenaria anguillulae PL171]